MTCGVPSSTRAVPGLTRALTIVDRLILKEKEIQSLSSSWLCTTSLNCPRSQYSPERAKGVIADPKTSFSMLCFNSSSAVITEDFPLLLRPTTQVKGERYNHPVSRNRRKFWRRIWMKDPDAPSLLFNSRATRFSPSATAVYTVWGFLGLFGGFLGRAFWGRTGDSGQEIQDRRNNP